MPNFDAYALLRYFRGLLDGANEHDLLSRVVMNRAYLAAYLHIKEVLKNLDFKFKDSSKDYRDVEDFLAECNEEKGPGISQRLRALRDQRVKADYDFSHTVRITKNKARKNLKKSKEILRNVDRDIP